MNKYSTHASIASRTAALRGMYRLRVWSRRGIEAAYLALLVVGAGVVTWMIAQAVSNPL